jgi:hypothetical protein
MGAPHPIVLSLLTFLHSSHALCLMSLLRCITPLLLLSCTQFSSLHSKQHTNQNTLRHAYINIQSPNTQVYLNIQLTSCFAFGYKQSHNTQIYFNIQLTKYTISYFLLNVITRLV